MKQSAPLNLCSKMCAFSLTITLGSVFCGVSTVVQAQEQEAAPAAAPARNIAPKPIIPKVNLNADPASWNDGGIRLNDELFELSRPEVEASSPVPGMVRRDVMRLMVDHGYTGVALSDALKNRKSQTERWLGYAYASAGDERAVSCLENVLAQTPKPVPTKAAAVDLTYALLFLSHYYEKKGEISKAAMTQARILEYFQGSIPKDVEGGKIPVEGLIANNLVSAARLYQQSGETQKAEQLYAQVSDYDYGWAQGIALIDQARVLTSQKKLKEAREFLQSPIAGKFTEQIEPVRLVLLGRTYLADGDLQSAKRHIGRAIDTYNTLKTPLEEEGLENIIASAKKDLSYINDWIEHPIQSDTSAIEVKVNPNATKSMVRRIHLQTFVDMELKASVNSELVRARIVTAKKTEQQERTSELILEITPEALHEKSQYVLTIASGKETIYKTEIPITID